MGKNPNYKLRTIAAIAVLVCASVWTVLICNTEHVNSYEAQSVIFQTLPKNTQDSVVTKDSCPPFHRVFYSNDLKEKVIEQAGVEELNDKTYESLILRRETQEKIISLHVYMHDSAATLNVANILIGNLTDSSLYHSCYEVIEKPHIVSEPSIMKIVLYAGLSLVFALLFIWAIIIIWNHVRRDVQ